MKTELKNSENSSVKYILSFLSLLTEMEDQTTWQEISVLISISQATMASTLENTLQQITKTLTSPCFSLGSPIHSSMACPVKAHRIKISSCQNAMLTQATLPYPHPHSESVVSTKNPSTSSFPGTRWWWAIW